MASFTKTKTTQNFKETKNEVTPKYFNLIYKSRLWTLTRQLQNLHFSFETFRSGLKKQNKKKKHFLKTCFNGFINICLMLCSTLVDVCCMLYKQSWSPTIQGGVTNRYVGWLPGSC